MAPGFGFMHLPLTVSNIYSVAIILKYETIGISLLAKCVEGPGYHITDNTYCDLFAPITVLITLHSNNSLEASSLFLINGLTQGPPQPFYN